MTRGMSRGARSRLAMVSIVALVWLLVTAGLVACSASPRVSPTVRVSRGTVATKVTAAGALTAVTSQNLAFPKGAQLTELHVKVGDRVRRGQVLAKVDDFAFRQALAQQQATLNQQRAQLNRIVNGTSVSAARATLEQAKRILSATQKNVAAQREANSDATRRARVQLDFDTTQLERAKRRLAASGCGLDDSGRSRRPLFNRENTATGSLPGLGSPSGQDSQPGLGPVIDPQPATRTGRSGGVTGGTALDPMATAASSCASLQQGVTAAERQVLASQTAHNTAKNKEDVDETSGRLAVENARQSVVSAENTLKSAETDRPSEIAAQQALVDSAQASVALAQRDVENTVLRAPVDGTVAAINGAIGEFVGSASSGTTPLAPGSNAPIPGTGVPSAGDPAASAAGSSAPRPGGSAFIVLNDVNTFHVVVPFEEADAAKIAPNQRVEVTFDAIPDLVRQGTVLSVAPAGTSISGVTNYYATIVLTETDPRLRGGQTAQVAVLTDALDNVLTVPNSAVIKEGDRTFVNTPGPDGQPRRIPFQAGKVGDDTTQVLSGLTEGQPILTPQAQVEARKTTP